jgi:hypothetical protein
MAIQLVPAGDERCDICAGGEPPKRMPGERSSARASIKTTCERCYRDFARGLRLVEKFIDPTTREVEPPDDPSKN